MCVWHFHYIFPDWNFLEKFYQANYEIPYLHFLLQTMWPFPAIWNIKCQLLLKFILPLISVLCLLGHYREKYLNSVYYVPNTPPWLYNSILITNHPVCLDWNLSVTFNHARLLPNHILILKNGVHYPRYLFFFFFPLEVFITCFRLCNFFVKSPAFRDFSGWGVSQFLFNWLH